MRQRMISKRGKMFYIFNLFFFNDTPDISNELTIHTLKSIQINMSTSQDIFSNLGIINVTFQPKHSFPYCNVRHITSFNVIQEQASK
jgi:hypothetical protein